MTDPQTMEHGQLERRARRMRRANVVMRRVLALPFPTPLSGQLMLLDYRGRRSGRRYRQPVSYVRDGTTLLSPGGGRWTLNLTGGETIRVRLRGRDEWARPELVRDADEVSGLLQVMIERNSRLSSFVPFVERDGRIDRTKLEAALSHGFCIVRWHLGEHAPIEEHPADAR
jgi:hypothetical protein